MKKRKAGFLQKGLAVLLAAVLAAGTAQVSAPVNVRAEEEQTANTTLKVTLHVRGYVPGSFSYQASCDDSIQVKSITPDAVETLQEYAVVKITFGLNVTGQGDFSLTYGGHCMLVSDPISPGGEINWGPIDVWPVRLKDGETVLELFYVGNGWVFDKPQASPEKNGYTFSHWENSEGKKAFVDGINPDQERINGATDFYASWTREFLAQGEGWTFDQDRKLTIESDTGMDEWISSSPGRDLGQVMSVEIKSGVSSIKEGALKGCYSLGSITIPESVASIEDDSFNGCDGLTEVTLLGETPPALGTSVFEGCGFVEENKKGIHVPEGKAETYKNAAGWDAWAAYIAEDTPPAETHEHNGVTFTAWTEEDSLPDTAGNFYLTKDVTVSSPWQTHPGEQHLCLNGHTIRLADAPDKNSPVICIYAEHVLNLYDCEGAGRITGGADGGVFGAKHSKFRMYGGIITGNSGSVSGVQAQGAFCMYGGEISGNSSTGSGRSALATTQGGTITVGGNAVITGNTNSEGKAANLRIGSGDAIIIDSANPLSGNARIGITADIAPTADNPVSITGANGADYSSCFTSDNEDYEIANNESNEVLLVAHTHAYGAEWESDETGHWHVCACGEKSQAAGHVEDGGTVTKEPTETDTGIKTYRCSVCGYELRTQEIERLEYFTVEVSTDGGGVVLISCGQEQYGSSARLLKGTEITVRAVQDEGYTFAGWMENGSPVSGDRDYSFTLESGRSLAAVFEKDHTHNYGTLWKSDETGHWHVCACGEKSQAAGHVEDGGTVTKEPTETEPGIKTYRCSVCGYEMRTETLQATGAGDDGSQDAGKVDKDVQTDGKAPGAQISTPARELADCVLTPEEIRQWEGGTDIRIVLDIKDASESADSGEKALVEAKLAQDPQLRGYKAGQYLDVSLFKFIGESRSAITRTNAKIRLTVAVPDSLKNAGGEDADFAVIRVHEGVAETLEDLDDNAETITIETDSFSTYVIVCSDTDGTGDDNTGDDGTGDDNTGDDGNGDDNTGDDGNVDDNTGDDGNGDDNTGDDGNGNGNNGNTGDDGNGNGNTGDDGNGDDNTGDGGNGDGSNGNTGDNNNNNTGDGNNGNAGHDGNGSTSGNDNNNADGGNGGSGTGGDDSSHSGGTGAPAGGDAKPSPTKDGEPKTGTSAPFGLYATLAMIAGFTYLYLCFEDSERGMTEETKKELVAGIVRWAKQGGWIRKLSGLAAIFLLLVYYHSIGKKLYVKWKEIYE